MRKEDSFSLERGSFPVKLQVSLRSYIIISFDFGSKLGNRTYLKRTNVRKPQALLILGNMNEKTVIKIWNLRRK
jgi:hypothetical protein